MQIVIDVPEHIYEHIKEVYEHSHTVEATYSYIYNGTPLPKGHGRLIDANDLEECKEIMTTIMNECKYAVLMDEIRNVPTIIEADTESEVPDADSN